MVFVLVTYEIVVDLLNNPQSVGMKNIWCFMNLFTEDALKSDNIQNLAKSQDKFDLVIVEAFMGQEAMLIFGHIFKAPTIVFDPFGTFSIVNRVMGNSLALPYVPEFNFPFSNQMSLYEKLQNSYGVLRTLFEFYNYQIPTHQSLLDRYLDIPDAPSLGDLIKNVSLVFTNGHQLTSYPQPLTPNIIPLGGIHLSKERKPLPKVLLYSFITPFRIKFSYFNSLCIQDIVTLRYKRPNKKFFNEHECYDLVKNNT